MKTYVDTVRLSFSHANIIGSLPSKNVDSLVKNKATKDLGDIFANIRKDHGKTNPVKNGSWWSSGSPDFVKYFPEVDPTSNPDEVNNPPETEFVYPVFRAISEVLLHHGRWNWNLDLYTEENVLRRSMNLLIGQAIYPDHDETLGQELGVVLDAFYEAEYEIQLESGEMLRVPPGINVVLKIDAKAHPEIARRIMMDPPSIHSCSTTFMFSWRPSHDLSGDGEGNDMESFFSLLGTRDENGEIYRRVCTEVLAYRELSLVPHGADSFAKKINQETGQITLPEHTSRMAQLLQNSTPPINPTLAYEYSYKAMKEAEPLKAGLTESKKESVKAKDEPKLKTITTPSPTDNIQRNQQSTRMNNNSNGLQTAEMIRLGVILNLDEQDSADPIRLSQAIEKLAADYKSYLEEVTHLRASKSELLTETNVLKSRVEALEPVAKVGEEALTMLRNQVIRQYHQIHNRPDAAMVAMIQGADYLGLQSFHKQFSEKLDAKYSGVCNSCGSTDVTRASVHFSSENKVDEADRLKNTSRTNEDLLKELTASKPKNRFHE